MAWPGRLLEEATWRWTEPEALLAATRLPQGEHILVQTQAGCCPAKSLHSHEPHLHVCNMRDGPRWASVQESEQPSHGPSLSASCPGSINPSPVISRETHESLHLVDRNSLSVTRE